MLKFLPDASDIEPENLQLVSAIPTLRGYASPPSGMSLGIDALAATPQGGALLLKLDGSSRTIVGTATKLYEAQSTSWTDRSRGGNYSIGSGRWRLAQFGNTTLAINLSTVLQSSTTGAFADVANAPKAALMEAAAGFVMLANCDDTGSGLSTAFGAQEHRWWCSQIFNPTGTWAPSVSTQATTGLLVETPGAITALRRLLNDVCAYKSRSIYVGRYVGSPVVWQWSCVSNDIGCASQEAVVNAGTAHYFVGDDDVYTFDGSRPVPIGAGIKEWFFGRLNRSYASNIRALHDRINSLIYWYYPSGTDGSLTSCIVYHYETRRWGHFDLAVQDVLEAITSTVTYDSLGTLFATYDDLPNISYDAPFWNAATPVLSYFDSSKVLQSLSGTAASASLRTGWYGDEDTVSVVTRVKPRYRIKPSSATCTRRCVMQLGDTVDVGTAATEHDGRFDVLQAARYHQFDLAFTGRMEIEAVVPKMVAQGAE